MRKARQILKSYLVNLISMALTCAIVGKVSKLLFGSKKGGCQNA